MDRHHLPDEQLRGVLARPANSRCVRTSPMRVSARLRGLGLLVLFCPLSSRPHRAVCAAFRVLAVRFGVIGPCLSIPLWRPPGPARAASHSVTIVLSHFAANHRQVRGPRVHASRDRCQRWPRCRRSQSHLGNLTNSRGIRAIHTRTPQYGCIQARNQLAAVKHRANRCHPPRALVRRGVWRITGVMFHEMSGVARRI